MQVRQTDLLRAFEGQAQSLRLPEVLRILKLLLRIGQTSEQLYGLEEWLLVCKFDALRVLRDLRQVSDLAQRDGLDEPSLDLVRALLPGDGLRDEDLTPLRPTTGVLGPHPQGMRAGGLGGLHLDERAMHLRGLAFQDGLPGVRLQVEGLRVLGLARQGHSHLNLHARRVGQEKSDHDTTLLLHSAIGHSWNLRQREECQRLRRCTGTHRVHCAEAAQRVADVGSEATKVNDEFAGLALPPAARGEEQRAAHVHLAAAPGLVGWVALRQGASVLVLDVQRRLVA
mmetsp:Transcript_159793/g.512774  ORF Transcript_159793/g.512774 Transcript_159793/m.512774 type:complete len:284 (-) Transcript_159793:2900-3751(-)